MVGNKMRKLTLWLLMAMTSGMTMAANYKIDALHTNARFEVDHFATSSNIGGFFNLDGVIEYDAKARTGAVDLTIPVKTLDSGRTMFNEHLLSKAFFNEAEFPTMRFVSNQWDFDQQGKPQQLRGQLTLLGQTYPVVLKATKFNCYQSPMAKTEVCGGDFETVIDRTQWGMNEYVKEMPASRYVKLHIQVEAAKQPQ